MADHEDDSKKGNLITTMTNQPGQENAMHSKTMPVSGNESVEVDDLADTETVADDDELSNISEGELTDDINDDFHDDIDTQSQKSNFIMSKFARVCSLERMYRLVLVINIIWMCVHAIFFTGFGILMSTKSGKFFSDFFFYDFDRDFLSPLVPVWNDIGEVLPFGNYFLTPILLSFLLAVINTLLATLCIILNCFHKKRHINFNILLIISCYIYSMATIVHVLVPQFYVELVFTHDTQDMVNLIGLYYDIVTTHPFSNALNMAMVMGKCCGVNGVQDFQPPYNITIHPNVNVYLGKKFKHIKALPAWPQRFWATSIYIPPACCRRGHMFREPEADFEALLRCSSGKDETLYYTRGCGKVYETMFRDFYLPTIRSIGLVSSSCLFVLAVWSSIRLHQRWHKPKANLYKSPSEDSLNPEHFYYHEEEEEDEEEAVEKIIQKDKLDSVLGNWV